MKKIACIITILIVIYCAMYAQEMPTVSESNTQSDVVQKLSAVEKELVINKICEVIDLEYVFPEVADQCIKMLNDNLKLGKYKKIDSPEKFTEKVEQDLQLVSNDKHFRVKYINRDNIQSNQINTPEDDFLSKIKSNQFLIRGNYGFMNVKWISGNIGYLDIRAFVSPDIATEKAVAVMKYLSDMDAIIIDLRNAVMGGSPEMVALISSYFFEKPTLMNTFYNRRTGETTEEWTLSKTDGKPMPDVSLFILTNKDVFSACEGFAYSLQAQKRAIIIGEPTKGGAHLTRKVRLNDNFTLTIPFERAVNPITGTNWEGIGVQPDILVKSDSAYDVALEKARKAADEHRKLREENELNKAKQLFGEFSNIIQQYMQGEKDTAVMRMQKLLTEGYASKILTEEIINDAGYDLMEMKAYGLALVSFKFNSEKFPFSYNAFDSLGELYMSLGETDHAINSFKKSLEINLNYDHAKKMLEQLKSN